VALFKAKEQDWDYQSIRDRALNHFSEFAFFRKVKQVIEQELGQKGLLMEIL
jgi:hypothetical protein